MTTYKNGLRVVDAAAFCLEPGRYEIRENDLQAPLCPFGNQRRFSGFDKKTQEYVRFTTSVFRKIRTKMENQRPPLPPFTEETAKQKIQMAEDAWNSKDPVRVSLAYTPDSEWRNRNLFINGREEIVQFLTGKWQKEQQYKLKKEYWAHTGNRIAVRFEYEYHDESGQWWRAYGNENWEFDENGLMRKRFASINDLAIEEKDRKLL